MSHMSRADIVSLVNRFEQKESKTDSSDHVAASLGLQLIKKELGTTTGAPSLRLRELGKILKHYSEELDKKSTTAREHFEYAIALFDEGATVQVAIKKARLFKQRPESEKKRQTSKTWQGDNTSGFYGA